MYPWNIDSTEVQISDLWTMKKYILPISHPSLEEHLEYFSSGSTKLTILYDR